MQLCACKTRQISITMHIFDLCFSDIIMSVAPPYITAIHKADHYDIPVNAIDHSTLIELSTGMYYIFKNLLL